MTLLRTGFKRRSLTWAQWKLVLLCLIAASLSLPLLTRSFSFASYRSFPSVGPFSNQEQRVNIGPKVIRANQFILEDETGNVRVGLIVGKNGPGLIVLDETGKKIWSRP